MLERYELLIKLWADDASNNDGVFFKYAKRDSDGESISLLFTEAVIKRALQKLVLCVSSNNIEAGKYKAIDDLREVIEPLRSKVLDEDYIYSEVDEEDLSVIEILDENEFSNWVIYVLKHSLLPMSQSLEKWNKKQVEELV